VSPIHILISARVSGSRDGKPADEAKQNRDQWFAGGLGGAFLLPPANSFGNFGLNNLFGPIYINEDISLSKNIRIKEQIQLNPRADAYNALNHTHLGLPNANITDPKAGQITSTAYGSQMRRLQFALRLDF
jgi:hypothetical protein